MQIQRANTADEKIQKGEFILKTAESMVRSGGIDALSMNKLCDACGVAKGTLYLYFQTRHEILATLYIQILWDWVNGLVQTLPRSENYNEFCTSFCTSLIDDPLIVQLLLRGPNDFETGLPDDSYGETMTFFQNLLEKMADIFCASLGIDAQKSSQMVWAFYTAILGAAPYLHAKPGRSGLSGDLQTFRDALTFETLFLNAVTALDC